ncbi:MAG: Flp pilus assembly protein CpaB [Acidimicrobiia bacterium]
MSTTSLPAAAAPIDGPHPPRRLPRRLSRGHVMMIVAGVAGMVLSYAALQEQPSGARVAVAAHEIRAGEAVRPADFRTEPVSMGESLIETVVRAGEIQHLRGRIAGSTIPEGELVPRRTLRPRAARAGLRAMSIPIDPARAVGGRLASGDRVDVLFAGARTVSIIVADAEVLAVDARGRGGIGDSSSPFTVTIAVTARQSQLVAAAVADGNISLARTTGADSAKGTAPEPIESGQR